MRCWNSRTLVDYQKINRWEQDIVYFILGPLPIIWEHFNQFYRICRYIIGNDSSNNDISKKHISKSQVFKNMGTCKLMFPKLIHSSHTSPMMKPELWLCYTWVLVSHGSSRLFDECDRQIHKSGQSTGSSFTRTTRLL